MRGYKSGGGGRRVAGRAWVAVVRGYKPGGGGSARLQAGWWRQEGGRPNRVGL